MTSVIAPPPLRGPRRGFAEHGAVNLGIDPTGIAHGYLTLMPVPSGNTVMLSTRSAAVLALVTTHAGQRVASVQQLMAWFRLTPAEARVTRALAHGDSLDEYAQREGVTRATVKTQLQAVFAKTGTSSQKDLVRLVLTLPAVRGDSGRPKFTSLGDDRDIKQE